ncbi:BatA domain-containing protein [Bizionia sp. KMM 8389]
MQFKHPEILYALCLLLIPIIVHLFQLRKFQRATFTNVAFLKKVSLQTRKSSQIKKWLVLTTRLLLLAFAIIAFAQPYFSKNTSFNSKPETVIYLDTSFSMQAKGEQGELLKRAIQEIIENVEINQPISLYTNSAVFKNTTLKSIQNDLLQLDYDSNQLPYDAALIKGSKLFSDAKNTSKNLIFISDFQKQDKSFTDLSDSLYHIHAVQLKPVSTQNIAIDSLSISSRTLNNTTLQVFLSTNGTSEISLPLSLYDGGKLLAKTTTKITNKAVAEFVITEKNIRNGHVNIEDNNLLFDNELFFNIAKPSIINVLNIYNQQPNNYLERLFPDEEFQFAASSLKQLNYSSLEKQQVIILDELDVIPSSLSNSLKAFMNTGGYVIIIPSVTSKIDSYNNLLSSRGIKLTTAVSTQKRVTGINYAHPIYAKVFEKQTTNFQYPKVNSFYTVSYQNNNVALSFEDGKPFLVTNKELTLFTAALDSENSNFNAYDLIVPTFYNLARQSLRKPQLYATIGTENTFDIPVKLPQDNVLSLTKNAVNLIPMQQYFNDKVSITTTDLPEEAGVYNVTNNGETLTQVSFNYNRNESLLDYQDLNGLTGVTVTNSVTSIFETLKSDTKINELWKWFAIFALAFLIIEMLILKYFK